MFVYVARDSRSKIKNVVSNQSEWKATAINSTHGERMLCAMSIDATRSSVEKERKKKDCEKAEPAGNKREPLPSEGQKGEKVRHDNMVGRKQKRRKSDQATVQGDGKC